MTKLENATLQEIGFKEAEGEPGLILAIGQARYSAVKFKTSYARNGFRWNLYEERPCGSWVRVHETDGSLGLFLLQVGAWWGLKFQGHPGLLRIEALG